MISNVFDENAVRHVIGFGVKLHLSASTDEFLYALKHLMLCLRPGVLRPAPSMYNMTVSFPVNLALFGQMESQFDGFSSL